MGGGLVLEWAMKPKAMKPRPSGAIGAREQFAVRCPSLLAGEEYLNSYTANRIYPLGTLEQREGEGLTCQAYVQNVRSADACDYVTHESTGGGFHHDMPGVFCNRSSAPSPPERNGWPRPTGGLLSGAVFDGHESALLEWQLFWGPNISLKDPGYFSPL